MGGWGKSQLSRVLTELKPAEVDLDGVPGIALADDLDPVPDGEPWAALLPGLDSTPMGWQQRDWFLGQHGPRLFDRAGTSARPCGGTAGSWVAGRRTRAVRSSGGSWRMPGPRRPPRSGLRRSGWPLLGGTRLAARTRGRTWLEDELAR